MVRKDAWNDFNFFEKSLTIIVLLLIFPFILVSICLTYCGSPMLGAHIFIIVIYSSLIDPLIIM